MPASRRPGGGKQRIKNYLQFLALPGTSPRVHREIFRTAPDPLIKAVSNIALNALEGNVAHFSTKQKQKLAKHKNQIRQLARRQVPIARKRKILVGGALPLIPIMIGRILGTVGERLFSKVF